MTLRLFRMSTLGLLVLFVTAARAVATDLRITDSQGVQVVVTAAAIDYSGMFSADKESQGVRVLQGDGQVLVKWADIESIRLTAGLDSAKKSRIELEIVLRNGRKATATLLQKGQMKLVGKTELGDYSIDIDKVRMIAPVK